MCHIRGNKTESSADETSFYFFLFYSMFYAFKVRTGSRCALRPKFEKNLFCSFSVWTTIYYSRFFLLQNSFVYGCMSVCNVYVSMEPPKIHFNFFFISHRNKFRADLLCQSIGMNEWCCGKLLCDLTDWLRNLSRIETIERELALFFVFVDVYSFCDIIVELCLKPYLFTIRIFYYYFFF